MLSCAAAGKPDEANPAARLFRHVVDVLAIAGRKHDGSDPSLDRRQDLLLYPANRSTKPRSEISPVIAVSFRMVRPVNSEVSARNIATPALGPSLGMAPAGT